MSFLKKINTKAKTEINTGFGTSSSSYGGRFVNKNGMANIEKKGLGFFESISWYHTMLQLNNAKFFFIILLFYLSVNFLFALLYLLWLPKPSQLLCSPHHHHIPHRNRVIPIHLRSLGYIRHLLQLLR